LNGCLDNAESVKRFQIVAVLGNPDDPMNYIADDALYWPVSRQCPA
jgi:hypothetical protein